MSRRYWNYRRSKPYRRYYYHNYQKSPLEGLLEVIFVIVVKLLTLIGNLTLKLISVIYSAFKKKQKIYKIEINKEVPSEKEISSGINSNSTPITQREDIHLETNAVGSSDYSLKQSLLTPAERSFFNILKQIVDDRYQIAFQVPMSALIKTENSHSYVPFNRIKAKTIDFVLYSKENLNPYLAVELDDRTHSLYKRVKRDEFVNGVLKKIGLPILHVKVQDPHSYDIEKLKEQIFYFSDNKN